MINLLMITLSKGILPLKTSQKFSSVHEPYAVKVASTVLRGGCHCEVMFLPDNISFVLNCSSKKINIQLIYLKPNHKHPSKD
jgi:hypothetical protein